MLIHSKTYLKLDTLQIKLSSYLKSNQESNVIKGLTFLWRFTNIFIKLEILARSVVLVYMLFIYKNTHTYTFTYKHKHRKFNN